LETGGYQLRALRTCTVAVAAFAVATAVLPAPAAMAAPVAPFTAMTIDGASFNGLPNGSLSFDEDNSDIVLSPLGTSGLNLGASVSNTSRLSVTTTPPAGTTWVVGQTYQTRKVPEKDQAMLDLAVNAQTCGNQMPGTITIREFAQDPQTQEITAFAATYQATCEGVNNQPFAGELRWHSTVNYVATVSNAPTLDYGTTDIGRPGTPKTVTFTATGSSPVVFGTAVVAGGNAGTFRITTDNCSGKTIAFGQTCTVTLTPRPRTQGANRADLAIPDNTIAGKRIIHLTANAIHGAFGTYYQLTPNRIMDTRFGLGAPRTPIGAGRTHALQVTGRGGVPSTGVSAVVLNVTLTGPTASGGHLTVWPTGATQPTASSLNFVRGWTGANSVTVAVGTGGKVSIFNSAGNTHIIVDVLGFFASNNDVLGLRGLGGALQPVVPQRLLDTRTDFGTRLPKDFFVIIPVSYGAAVNPHIRALAVNVTAVSPTGPGFLTSWNGQGDLPPTSTLNYTAGAVVPNMAIVPVAPCPVECQGAAGLPSIAVYTSRDTHVLVDIVGFFDDSGLANGLRFQPRAPTRIVDSRIGLGTPQAIGQGRTAKITAPGSVLPEATEALALNVTAVNASAGTHLTIWPDGIPGIDMPNVSNLNPARGQTIPNAAITLLGPSNAFNVFNNIGTVNIVIDVNGAYYLYDGTASGGTQATPGAAKGAESFRLTPHDPILRPRG
jgi:hypothetical protein